MQRVLLVGSQLSSSALRKTLSLRGMEADIIICDDLTQAEPCTKFDLNKLVVPKPKIDTSACHTFVNTYSRPNKRSKYKARRRR